MNTLKQLRPTLLALVALIFALNVATAAEPVKRSGRTVVAEVVAFDQAFLLNRLGSRLDTPRIFALRKDVELQDGKHTPLPCYNENPDLKGMAGYVQLKSYKRARPIVLRANVGDILEIRFTNLLTDQMTGEFAGCHVMGLSLATSIDDDSSWVGKNDPPAASPSPAAGSFSPNANASAAATKIYRYVVDAEGVFILYSAADPTGNNGSLNEGGNGLFGCVIVQPPHAEYYRSQVVRTDLIDATYDSQKLPANMVLHLEPKRPNEPVEVEHWLLTTYKTRLRDFVVKNVEVEIVPETGIEAQTASSEPKEQAQPKDQARTKAAPPKPQLQNFVRDLATGEALKGAVPPTNRAELRKAQEKGEVVPQGKLYSLSTKHPLINYQVAYSADHTRPSGWPVLEMLYPEAKTLLPAQKANSTLGIVKDATVFKLPPGSEKDKYASAVTQLDTGTVPRDLWPVLNAWGVKEMPDITRVSPQRDYYDVTSDKKELIPREGSANFIWLLTGVEISGRKNSSVIIHGDVKDPAAPTLRFLEVELQLFHSDLTAIITGPQAEGFGNMQESPSAFVIPASPERAQPYREFALGYHNGGNVTQAFPIQNSGPLANARTLVTGNDNFGINYGMAGIATEILANRLGKGPEGYNQDGVDLKFEEFFLSSWAVGDPAMLVDRPANGSAAHPAGPAGPQDRATKVFYPDDPSNVYHSYMRDHVKMRIYNAGENAPHVHHLHAHQWLRSPNSDEASYLDSQLIVPGSAFSLEITYNGSGNRNQTVGDSIFHCHFYPHFAQGMWSLWRVHDVFEEGTPLDKDGKVVAVGGDPTKWVRALPDAEIDTGTPIPAIVPLPTLAMPPIPPAVRLTKIPDLPANPAGGTETVKFLQTWVNISKAGKNPSQGRMVQVKPDGAKDGEVVFSNPGYPFFVPGVAGHRPPHPPLDMGWEEKNGVPDLTPTGEKKYLDGGLPRHQVLGGQIVREFHTPWDFTKDYIRYDKDEKPVDGAMVAYRVPEDGTPIEKAAMEAHRTRTVKTVEPDGRPGNFIHNGLPPVSGAPFADPGVDDQGNAVRSLRKYKAAVIQKDVVFNKAGWHYPQQRFLTLWQDVEPTFAEKRPAQPFFFRANSGETVEYWHTNLVPEYYELDDFQVRTPTDIIGQHIHLVKFDVLASDGAVNGFNYEDGTISSDDVRGRIYAITRPFPSATPGKYNLFEMTQPKPAKTAAEATSQNYVAGIDWSHFVKTTPTPAPWKGSYLQREMSQGAAGKANPLNPPAGQNWDGAMTTIQRFSTDPLLNNQGIDRTVRTVFTHDHFGPSTHQQAGLYAGFLVEPEKSVWRDPVTGGLYYDPVTRTDGGPTGWEAIIEPPDTAQSYREFAVEFQDLQLAYTKDSPKTLQPMKNISFGQLAFPIDASNAQTPVAKQKVKDLMVDGPQVNGRGTRISLTEFLKGNGITLTNDARLAEDAQGVIDDGSGSLYNYGPNEPAFQLKFDASSKDLKVKLLQGLTWASPGNGTNFGSAIGRNGPLNPQIISGGGKPGGTYSVNYRNEPLSFPFPTPPPGASSSPQEGRVTKGSGAQIDMSFAYASIQRPPPWDLEKPDVHGDSPAGQAPKVPSLFARPKDPAETNGPWEDKVGFAAGNGGVNDGKISNWDPYTPLLRGYQGDPVQVRALVGAHTQPHSFTINGVKWLGEMKSKNSGLRDAQEMGISEHFEFEFQLPPASTDSNTSFADYLYAPSSGNTGQGNGVWGLLRSYDNPPRISGDLVESPIATLRRVPEAANPRPYATPHAPIVVKHPDKPDVEFTLSARAGPIVYNSANADFKNQTAMFYTVDKVQANKGGTLQNQNVSTKPGEPLILRVNAGSWVKVILNNLIPAAGQAASTTVGLHPQLVAYDMSSSDGAAVGFNNRNQVIITGAGAQEYWWYAGDLEMNKSGEIVPHARELGAINLCPAAPLNQDANGLLGALIVEPAGATWAGGDYVTQAADILDGQGKFMFRDFVLIQQTNIVLPNQGNIPNLFSTSAVNNRSADPGFRLSPSPTPPVWQVLSNSLPGAPVGGPPNTPVFYAKAGDPVRFRVLQPGGDSINANIMFEIHGHSWQQEPWINSSSALGDNPTSNVLGADILVPHKALNILIDQAGGPNKVPGDYLYYNFLAGDGAWGIFRVCPTDDCVKSDCAQKN